MRTVTIEMQASEKYIHVVMLFSTLYKIVLTFKFVALSCDTVYYTTYGDPNLCDESVLSEYLNESYMYWAVLSSTVQLGSKF